MSVHGPKSSVGTTTVDEGRHTDESLYDEQSSMTSYTGAEDGHDGRGCEGSKVGDGEEAEAEVDDGEQTAEQEGPYRSEHIDRLKQSEHPYLDISSAEVDWPDSHRGERAQPDFATLRVAGARMYRG